MLRLEIGADLILHDAITSHDTTAHAQTDRICNREVQNRGRLPPVIIAITKLD